MQNVSYSFGSKLPKIIGITGIILTLVSMIFSLIPYLGYFALIPSFTAFCLCFIAAIHLKIKKEKSSVYKGTMIMACFPISFSIIQFLIFHQ